MTRLRRSLTPKIVALLALALQLALSCGHSHVGAERSAEVTATTAICATSLSAQCHTPAHHDGDRDCPICQATALAASAVVPTALALVSPSAVATTLRPTGLAIFRLVPLPRSFDARGPPAQNFA